MFVGAVHAPWLLSLATIMFESGAHAGTAAGSPSSTPAPDQLSGGRLLLLLLQTSLSPVGIGALLFQLDWLLAGRVNTRGNRNAAGWLREKWDPSVTGGRRSSSSNAAPMAGEIGSVNVSDDACPSLTSGTRKPGPFLYCTN